MKKGLFSKANKVSEPQQSYWQSTAFPGTMLTPGDGELAVENEVAEVIMQ